MRDKEWLKEQFTYYREAVGPTFNDVSRGMNNAYDNVEKLIDQLDEPETLSEEWIDENKVARINNVRKMTTSDVVTVEKLKNLIVPKQDKQEVEENFYAFDNAKKWLQDNGFVVFEKDKLDEEVQRMIDEAYDATNEKPLIPQFVADYIELNKGWSEDRQEYIEDDSGGLWFALDGNSYGMPNSVLDWLFNEEKVETFAKAWLDGYEVEKEPQWVVLRNCMYIKNFYFGEMNDDYRVGSIADKEQAMVFTDKAKAEAVALLVDGEVKEVTE